MVLMSLLEAYAQIMPKEVLKIERFDGGFNNSADPRDLAEGELSDITAASVSNLGKVTAIGRFKDATLPGVLTSSAFTTNAKGRQLFPFSHDSTNAHTGGAPSASESDYLISSSLNADDYTRIYSYTDDAWGTPIDWGSSASRIEEIVYLDGILRISNANFSIASSANQMLAHINTSGPSANLAVNKWYSGPQAFTKPTKGAYDTVTPVYGGVDSVTMISTADNGNNPDSVGEVFLTSRYLATGAKGAGTWDSDGTAGGSINFYASYIYNNSTESGLTALTDVGGASDCFFVGEGDKTLQRLEVTCKIYDGAAGGVGQWLEDDRVVGIALYYSEPVDNGTAESAERYFVGEFSLEKGARAADGGSAYSIWNTDGSTWAECSIDLTHPPKFQTYKSRNGYDHSASVEARFKTAVLAGRTLYVGNIFQDGVRYGDLMIKTPINKFDIYSLDRKIEVSIQDGDSIVKLEEYADRILQFKKHKMHLINIAQDFEFLEDTFMHKGVSNYGAVTKTDFGVAWVNTNGCYFYDGKQVVDLLEKKGRRLIKSATWASFITDNALIGFNPKDRQLIVIGDSDDTGHHNDAMYIFDYATWSWTKGVTGTDVDRIYSRITFDKDGNVIMSSGVSASSAKLLVWEQITTAAESSFSITTKELDFGNPSQRKKIYKIYVSSTLGTNLTISAIDEDGGSLTFDNTSLADGESVHQVTAGGNNIKALTITIAGSLDVGGEINDISIVYRKKGIK